MVTAGRVRRGASGREGVAVGAAFEVGTEFGVMLLVMSDAWTCGELLVYFPDLPGIVLQVVDFPLISCPRGVGGKYHEIRATNV
jgi:hypothetical protein